MPGRWANVLCKRRTLADHVPCLATRYARKTVLLAGPPEQPADGPESELPAEQAHLAEPEPTGKFAERARPRRKLGGAGAAQPAARLRRASSA